MNPFSSELKVNGDMIELDHEPGCCIAFKTTGDSPPCMLACICQSDLIRQHAIDWTASGSARGMHLNRTREHALVLPLCVLYSTIRNPEVPEVVPYYLATCWSKYRNNLIFLVKVSARCPTKMRRGRRGLWEGIRGKYFRNKWSPCQKYLFSNKKFCKRWYRGKRKVIGEWLEASWSPASEGSAQRLVNYTRAVELHEMMRQFRY